MLYPTVGQGSVFLILLVSGIICAVIFDANNLVTFLCNKNKVVKIILDFICAVLCGAAYFFMVLKFNYGEQRMFTLLAFLLGLTAERCSLGILLAKSLPWCYDKYAKLQATIKKLMNKKVKKKTDEINEVR